MKKIENVPDIQLLLASGSKYKKDVLHKLGIPFASISPDIDETPLLHESPHDLVTRLAKAKAEKVLSELKKQNKMSSQLFIVGIDQVAVYANRILGKPGDVETAIKQLSTFSGQKVQFLTGICLLNDAGAYEVIVEPFEVHFKELTLAQISQYIKTEMPLDCAGSFKSEGQGILLFSALSGRDPNALIGMPLIALQELFLRFNVDLFDYIQ